MQDLESAFNQELQSAGKEIAVIILSYIESYKRSIVSIR